MKRSVLVPILLVFAASLSSALSTATGSSRLDTLSSSGLMSLPSVGLTSGSASASVLNPAAAGDQSLPSGELFFAGLVNLSQSVGYLGSNLFAGGVFPTAYGVYSASAHFLTSSAPLELGTLGSVNLSLAKRLYPKLVVGAGLGLEVGRGNHFDWGTGLNLGFVHTSGELGVLEDFSWGAAIDGIGKPFAPYRGYAAFPPSFTPAIGAGFSVYKSKSVTARVSGQASFPTFRDARIGLGASLRIGRTARFSLMASVDLGRLLSSSPQALPLSAGVDFTFEPAAPAKVSRVRPSVAAEPLAPHVYAFGGGLSGTFGRRISSPPRINIGTHGTSYISPNGDGVKDALVVPLTITDRTTIVGYRMTVRSSTGTIVRTIASPSLAGATHGTGGLFDRLLYVKGGVPVPNHLTWNGRNDAGQVVPDGVYTYTISARDGNGNRSTTVPERVVVDTTAPSVKLVQPAGAPPIFSPNGDGYKDTLAISQTGSVEPLWTGRIFNASGDVVRTFTWRNSPPKSFAWNGRGAAGRVLPDGVYRYVLAATDRAGNTASASIPTIVIDTTRPTVELDVNADAISPGTTSPLQSVRYSFVVPDRNQVQSWKMVVRNSRGTVVSSTHGGAAIPSSHTFDGSGANGHRLPDGIYRAELTVVYRNGTHSIARAAAVTIDRTAPKASVTEEYHVFSPIGSSDRPTMIFDVSSSTEPVWNGTIANGAGTIVKRYRWHGTPPSKVSWNGRSASGRVEPDGVYQFSVSATTRAGNYGQSNVVGFVLDTQHKQLLLSTNYNAFSPNGARNIIDIIPKVRSPKGLQAYQIKIENRSGAVVGSFQGTGVPTGPFAWDGEEGGKPVPAGKYRAVMTGRYANGVSAVAETSWFSVVTTLPQLSVSSNYRIFSPNADGHRDTVTFDQAASGGSAWTGEILSERGKIVLEKHWRTTLPPTFTWDGRDSLGNRVANGSYSYRLSTVDRAGNAAQATVTGIVVDDTPTQVYIASEAKGFSPNGDGVMDRIAFRTVERPSSGMSSWRVDVVTAKGAVVRSWRGTGTPASVPVIWNGSTSSGVAPDGRYTARLTVRYLKGDVDHAATAPFTLVANPPVLRVHVSPLPFKTNGRKRTASPALEFHVAAHALDPIARWKLEIYTPAPEEPFREFSGKGAPPAVVRWAGRTANGLIPGAVYSYHLTVVDSFGNTTQVAGSIPIAASSH